MENIKFGAMSVWHKIYYFFFPWLKPKVQELPLKFVPSTIKKRDPKSPIYNCRNCGAPHDGILCEYCLTDYALPTKPLGGPTKEGLNAKTAVIIGVAVLVGVVCCAHLIKRKGYSSFK